MGIVRLNEFRVDFEDNTSQAFMGTDSKAVANALETDGKVIVALNRTKVNVGVETPIRYVKFNTAVTPDGALANKCKAFPESWVVQEGTKVIFTAISADGYQFDGWYA